MSQDQVKLKMNLPLDDDGFLRRECPHCQEQFKWHSTPNDDAAQTSPLPTYFCPLCGEAAKADAWWTQDQIEHATAITKAQVLGPLLNKFGSDLERLNRPGSSFRITTNPVHYAEPAPLSSEPNDMRAIVPACHPEEPVKVPEERHKPIHCIVCGQTVPLEPAIEGGQG